ncbi:MAG: hypothetical protein M8866_02935 [marine benthic group bacterium]|nr:hypothetical protein [Candidatus Benthicola marisminoris]
MPWDQALVVAAGIVGAVWWLLEKYVGGMKASVNALESALTEKDATIESKEAHIQFLESQISPTVQEHREAAIRVLEEKVDELTEELDAKETELEAAQEKAQRADAVDTYTQDVITNLQANLETIRSERASLIDAQKALLRSMLRKPEVEYPASIIQRVLEQAMDIEGPWPGYSVVDY